MVETNPLPPLSAPSAEESAAGLPDRLPRRIKSQDLLGQLREVEIDHDGRIYKLRLTQLNKLILTA